MASPTAKPLIWLLEEATPEVAQLMHHLERSLAGQAKVQRISYTDVLRQLPHEEAREGLIAVVAFNLPLVQNMAALLKGLSGPRPRLCFLPPTLEALAAAKPHQRFPVPISAVARHQGEAALLAASGFKPEHVVRLLADVTLSALPEAPRQAGEPLRIGLSWYNMAPAQREVLATEITRWQASAPERCEWHLYHLEADPPPDWQAPGVVTVAVTPARLKAGDREALDVSLVDPWWPDALPRPFTAPVTVYMPPGGAPGEAWQERLQAIMDAAGTEPWDVPALLTFRYQPLWKHLLAADERVVLAIPPADPAPLAAIRNTLDAWLAAERETWPVSQEEVPEDLAFYHWIYDYRVQASWFHDLWLALAEAKNGERHAILLAMNGIALHHATAAWLLKRLMARTALGRAHAPRRTFGRRFWWRFLFRQLPLVLRWVQTLRRCGRDPESDPLGVGREVALKLLQAARVEIRRRNEPAPAPGVPTIYLLSHRHGELDPFLLLSVLPGDLAVVVGPRAQRWPLIGRLAHSSAFVLTGRERGVVIADSIAAVRARRALALYPEVAEPTYLGESSPFRGGLLWIVQALERCQVIPVVLDDAFTLGPAGGTVDLWFGAPIPCSPETTDQLIHQVRMFFQRHVPRMRSLDAANDWIVRRVEESAQTPVPQPDED